MIEPPAANANIAAVANRRRASSRSDGSSRRASSRVIDNASVLLNASAGATQALTRPATPNAATPRRKTTNGRTTRLSATATPKAIAFQAELPSRSVELFFSAISASGRHTLLDLLVRSTNGMSRRDIDQGKAHLLAWSKS